MPIGTIINQIIFSESAGIIGTISQGTSKQFTISGSTAKSSTTLAMTSSTWSPIPTGSFRIGIQYLALANITTGSFIDIAANNTASTNVFARMKYQDGMNIPASA